MAVSIRRRHTAAAQCLVVLPHDTRPVQRSLLHPVVVMSLQTAALSGRLHVACSMRARFRRPVLVLESNDQWGNSNLDRGECKCKEESPEGAHADVVQAEPFLQQDGARLA